MIYHFNYRLYMRYAEERLMDLRGAGLPEEKIPQEVAQPTVPVDEEKRSIQESAMHRVEVFPKRNHAKGRRRKRRVA
jgi:hypothetical protein